MNRLLKIEIRKIKNSSSFWVLSGLYALILVFSVYAIQSFSFNFNINGSNVDGDIRQFMKFPHAWQNLTYIASYFRILPAILVIMLIGNEYTYRTFKQSIINGMSRGEYLLSKVLLIGLFSLCATVLVFLMAAIVGLMNTDSTSQFFSQSEYIPAFFLSTAGYLLFTALLIFFIKRNALAIALLFAYSFIIEPILAWRLDELGRYLPLKVLNRLNAFPYKDDVNQLIPDMNWEAPLVYTQDIIVSIVWIGVFVLMMFVGIRKMDIR